jgi:import inner membrane translocase subunit TIM21
MGMLAACYSDFGWDWQSRGLSKQQEEDPFDSLTDKVPERPVTVAEGVSYSLIILAGLAVAAAAACAVFKEVIFEAREYVRCFPLLGS